MRSPCAVGSRALHPPLPRAARAGRRCRPSCPPAPGRSFWKFVFSFRVAFYTALYGI